jgi:hypothetical protein
MRSRSLLTITGFAVAVLCSVFVFAQLRPDLVFSDTTPAGGDMGAHVWGPAFLRDNLLSSGQLSGWTPDWYAGFPAYQFYMVVPALAIIAVNAGFTPWLSVPLAAFILGLGVRLGVRQPSNRLLILTVASLVAVLIVPFPYGIAFKIIAVSGLVFMPLAAWWMARQTGAPEPVPTSLALALVFFLFDTNFTIYGGNVASTLAGEFAFAMSLCLTFVAIGWSFRGMDENRHRASAAVLIALVALCHIIPLFFLIASLAILILLPKNGMRLPVTFFGIAFALIPIAFADRFEGLSTEVAAVIALLVVVAMAVLVAEGIRERLVWLALTGPVAALLAAFWLVPFIGRRDLFNDMGWERLDEVGEALLTTPMRIALPIAVVGGVLSFATRERLGMLFSIQALTFAAAVANLGESKLWNARLLPFFYLSVYCLAALGIAAIVRYAAVSVSERYDQPDLRVVWGSLVTGLVAVLIVVGMPLRVLPLGSTNADGDYEWFGLRTDKRSFVSSWAAWNFSGYEEKNSYREYAGVVEAMDSLGRTNGCGRAMWEYDKDLDRYGTPMALMLLPHWTDGCIGSMEGLYFESSATTPFHFLNQAALSIAPSSAQRDLPYRAFEIGRGIAQLQVMGVRYYMAQSDEAIAAARDHPDLTEWVTVEPFVVFEVDGTSLVEGLAHQPVVATGPTIDDSDELATRFEVGWLSQAIAFYNDPRGFNGMPAADGPSDWERVTTIIPSDGDPIDPVTVSDLEVGTDRLSFTVDEIGKPVLVKVSYFPNWSVDGADGPWRIGPNLMVVVPTDTSVALSYGRTAVDWLGILLTLAGIAALVVFTRSDRRRVSRRSGAGGLAARSSTPIRVSMAPPESELVLATRPVATTRSAGGDLSDDAMAGAED